MHTTLLKEADVETLRSFLHKAFDELKYKDKDMYEELEMELYEDIHGCHFSESLLHKALSCMVNEDGTKGGHWTLEDTTSLAPELKHYNKYDWCFVMNMMYSDFYKVLGSDVQMYVRMSKAFLQDEDAPEGKALKYYFAMHE